LAENENGNFRGLEDTQLSRTLLRLREMILEGEFEPGERISEAALAGRIGVSRTPVRVALERLSNEGLLEPYTTGGFIVREFTLDDVWNGIEVRGLLEGGAARLAADAPNVSVLPSPQ
jgi:GntR family transcriptional regulator of vanillate catabolism